MQTTEASPVLARLFSELVDGASPAGAFILNSGDVGLLQSLDHLGAIRQVNAQARGPREGTF